VAVNKNFVVKNGLEVNTDLILANADTNSVGIGTTLPDSNYLLHVNGGIGATDVRVTGIATVLNELRVGTAGTVFTVIAGPVGSGQSVGIGTARPAYLLDVRSPVSTGQTSVYIQGDVRITGDLSVDDISFDDAAVQNLTVTDTLYVGGESGLSTFVGRSNFENYVDFQTGLIVSGIATIINGTDSTTPNNGALVIDGGLGVEKNVNIGGDLDVTGSVYIGGTTVSLRGTEVFIENKDIILGFTTTITPNDDTANHAGVAIASTEGYPLVSFSASGINTLPDTYKQMMWFRSGTLGFSTDIFGLNYGLAIGTTTVADGIRLAVGSDVTATDTDINAINGNFSSVVSGIVTATNIASTDIESTNLSITGIATIANISVVGAAFTNLIVNGSTNLNDLNVSGIATLDSLSIGSTQVISNSFELQNIASLDATTTATIEAAIANSPNTFTDLTVTGISTLGSVLISSGIVTASSGIVTYYGDGQYLDLTSNPTTGIGIGTTGGVVGYGITFIDFYGAGVSTSYYDSSVGIATIFFEGGGSGTIGIGTEFPTVPSPINGDLFYHADYARIFVYYDENIIGVGTDSYWVDAAPFNLGLLDIGDLSVSNLTVTNSALVTGIVTATAFVGDGSGLTGAGSTVFNDTTTNQEYYPLFTDITTGTITASGISTSKLTYNPSTGAVSAVDFNTTSDKNLKTNIKTVENSLETVEKLRGVSFDWKETGKSSYGVIAQELEEVLPELVKTGEIKSVNYNGIIGVLIEAIKDLKKEIEDLKGNK